MTVWSRIKKYFWFFVDTGFNIVILSVLTGLFAGVLITFYGVCVHYGEHWSVEVYKYIVENPWFIPLLFIALFGGALAIGSIVKLVPMIRGSGIPQIEGAARGIVPFRWYTTIISMFACSLACVFLGLSAGSEGPSLEMGGCCGDMTSRLLRRNQMTRRLQTAAGSSAGLAVAFNAPFTGMVFALEEAFRSFAAPVFICSALSVITALVTRNALRPMWGQGVGFTFDSFVFAEIAPTAFLYVALAAVIAAAFGVIFYYVMFATKKLIKKVNFWGGRGKYLIPFMLAGVFGLITPYAMGGGHSFIDALGTHGTGNIELAEVFGLGITVTLIFIIAFKFTAAVLAMACGVPCGVFIPMLAIGAGLGGLISVILKSLGMDPVYVDFLVVICMATFFVTIVKAPITGLVMVFELTGSMANLLPALLGITIGYVISEIFKLEPIYERSLEGFIHEEGLHKNTVRARISLVVKENSHADDNPLRAIVWPSNGMIVEIINCEGERLIADGETILRGGYTIVFEGETKNEDELKKYLISLVGKQPQENILNVDDRLEPFGDKL